MSSILQDEETMYAYNGAFSDEEVSDWLNKQIGNYARDGFGLWAVIDKSSNLMIGQCGITRQTALEQEVLEIGYLFNRHYWHKKFATEAAIACKEYAFDQLKNNEVFSIIRCSNIASINVAIRNGMLIRSQIIKHYRGEDMPHFIFSVRKNGN